MATLNYRMPPDISRNDKTSIAAQNDWLRGLMTQLKVLFENISGDNIKSIPGGKIDLNESVISGGVITVSPDGLTVKSGDTEIIRLDKNGLFANVDGNELKISNAGVELTDLVVNNGNNTVMHVTPTTMDIEYGGSYIRGSEDGIDMQVHSISCWKIDATNYENLPQ